MSTIGGNGKLKYRGILRPTENIVAHRAKAKQSKRPKYRRMFTRRAHA